MLRIVAGPVFLLALWPAPGGGQTLRYRDAGGREVERRCHPAEAPKKLPPADELVDSAAVLEAWSMLEPFDSAHVIVALAFTAAGTLHGARLVEPTDASSGTAVVSLIRTAIRPQRTADDPWVSRVRMTRVPRPAITVERGVFCPPEIARQDRPITRQFAVERQPGDDVPRVGRRLYVELELIISEGGRVTAVRSLRRSGLQDLDATLARDYEGRRFLPALLDGIPVASWFRTNGQRPRW